MRTTDSNHAEPVAPNLLLGRPAPSRTDEVWVAEITYVPTAEGLAGEPQHPIISGELALQEPQRQ